MAQKIDSKYFSVVLLQWTQFNLGSGDGSSWNSLITHSHKGLSTAWEDQPPRKGELKQH